MKSAAAVRLHIQGALSEAAAAAATPRLHTERDRLSSGVAALDALTHGGLPVGAITELTGSHSSGRTSAGLAFLAGLTAIGRFCAWVEAGDSLDPASAAAAAVHLPGLLWVRCGAAADAPPVPGSHPEPAPVAVPSLINLPARGGGSPHPRMEGRGMPEALEALLQARPDRAFCGPRFPSRRDRSIGTPGAPNRPLTAPHGRSLDREEQVATDRRPARRGTHLPMPPAAKAPAATPSQPLSPPRATHTSHDPWQRIHAAIRATDLLLQNGGFGAVVLDLTSIPPDLAWRIPLATWFRFRGACDRTRISLLLLTQHPCARSAAELVLRTGPAQFTGFHTVPTGLAYTAAIERSRFQPAVANIVSIRKPPQSERSGGAPGAWSARCAWARG